MTESTKGGQRLFVPGPGGENVEVAAHDVQPVFDGTIASAWGFATSMEDFIEMARLARLSDPKVARFLDAWDRRSASRRETGGDADAVCEEIGLAPVELLRIVADAAYR